MASLGWEEKYFGERQGGNGVGKQGIRGQKNGGVADGMSIDAEISTDGLAVRSLLLYALSTRSLLIA